MYRILAWDSLKNMEFLPNENPSAAYVFVSIIWLSLIYLDGAAHAADGVFPEVSGLSKQHGFVSDGMRLAEWAKKHGSALLCV